MCYTLLIRECSLVTSFYWEREIMHMPWTDIFFNYLHVSIICVHELGYFYIFSLGWQFLSSQKTFFPKNINSQKIFFQNKKYLSKFFKHFFLIFFWKIFFKIFFNYLKKNISQKTFLKKNILNNFFLIFFKNIFLKKYF